MNEFNSNNKLGFGTLRLPALSMDESDVDYDTVSAMVDAFLGGGGRYFECAYHYCGGNAEAAIKKCLVDRYPRESYLLADKMPVNYIYKKEKYNEIFTKQLYKCGVKYFDYYLLHNIGRETYERTLKLGGFEYLVFIKKSGLARYIGFSFHDSPELLEEILAARHDIFDFVQLQINYLDWNSPEICSKRNLEIANKYNLPVIVMEPLKGGKLAELPLAAAEILQEPVSIGLRFAATRSGVFMVLSGMKSPEQVAANCMYLTDIALLNAKEYRNIDTVIGIINSQKCIGCTNCGYCEPVCPKKIPIPAIFSLYNNFTDQTSSGRKHAGQSFLYDRLVYNGSKASDCIKCGKCENVCSQRLQIRNNLYQAAKIFESNKTLKNALKFLVPKRIIKVLKKYL